MSMDAYKCRYEKYSGFISKDIYITCMARSFSNKAVVELLLWSPGV